MGTWAPIGDEDKKPHEQINDEPRALGEGIAEKFISKGPWPRSQRCPIPAESFDSPSCESGKNEWGTLW